MLPCVQSLFHTSLYGGKAWIEFCCHHQAQNKRGEGDELLKALIADNTDKNEKGVQIVLWKGKSASVCPLLTKDIQNEGRIFTIM